MNKKAVALILTIMVSVVLATLGISFLSVSINEKNLVERYKCSTQAFWVAEAGLQHAIRDFKDNNLDQDHNWYDNEAEGGIYLATPIDDAIDYELKVSGLGSDSVTLLSTGSAQCGPGSGFTQRVVSAIYEKEGSSPFTYAAFGNTGVSLLGNTRTDSYDSRLGTYGGSNIEENGDVGTSSSSSGAITLIGSSKVKGDAQTGEDGEVSLGWSCEVTGEISDGGPDPVSSVVVPEELSSLTSSGGINLNGSNSQVLSSGNYLMSNIKVSGNAELVLEGDVNIYLTDSSSLNVSGSGRLLINGTANIYVDGSVKTTGSGVVKSNKTNPSPSDFTLYGSTTSNSVKISGSGTMYGAIYAPDADVSIKGNSRLYGAAVGGAVTITGSSKIHYDQALSDSGSDLGSGSYNLVSWQEGI